MSGRIPLATIGLMALSVVGALTSTAGAATPAVPGVTSVHTGEFWSGILPVSLLSGMGPAGPLLIGRRRVFSAARSLIPLTPTIRRRGGQ